MSGMRDFISYLFFLFTVILLLKIFGLLYVSTTFVTSFFFISFGIGTVLFTLGKQNNPILILGVSFFFIGLLFYIVYELYLVSWKEIAIPALLFVAGMNFLILWFDDTQKRIFLLPGLILLCSPIFYMFIIDRFHIQSIFNNIVELLSDFWFIFLITFITLILVFSLFGLRRMNIADDE